MPIQPVPSPTVRVAPPRLPRSRRRVAARSRAAAPAKPARPQGGARILTRAEAFARTQRPPPGGQNGHEWLSEMFRPLREYNLWLIKNGHEPLGELDLSLRGEEQPA